MGLVSAIAFQLCPAIQSRAFIVIGTLATAEVDDDFMYQMLVAFQASLLKTIEDDTKSAVCILRCISQVVPALLQSSKYPGHLIWLGVALLQSGHSAFFAEACNLIQAATNALMVHEELLETTFMEVLDRCRTASEDILEELDMSLGLCCRTDFTFSLAAIVIKGTRQPGFLKATEDLMRSLLIATTQHSQEDDSLGLGHRTLPRASVGFFLALLPYSTKPKSYHQLLADSGADIQSVYKIGANGEPLVSAEFIGASDRETALLATTLLTSMLSAAHTSDTDTEMCYALLVDIGRLQPEIIALSYVFVYIEANAVKALTSFI